MTNRKRTIYRTPVHEADSHLTSNPRIVFPCDYPIKVIGDTSLNFLDEVVTILCKHDPAFTADKVRQRISSKGNYTSLSVAWIATGEGQLGALFQDLMALTSVRLVL